MAEPSIRTELEIKIDYHAFLIYDAANADDPASDTAERAIDETDSAGLQVGVADKLIAFATPVQFNYSAPMRVEVWPTEPADDTDAWDHAVDIDLDLPSGHLVFRQSGPTDEAASCDLPAGLYRARLAGRGYRHTSPQGGGLDGYRAQLWPRTEEAPAQLRKAWPGWSY